MRLTDIILPSGILTIIFMLATIFGGLYNIQLKRHKLLALLTIAFSLVHVVTILYLKYF